MGGEPEDDWGAEAAEIARRRAWAKEMGGAQALARQHEKGRLSVRERLDTLLDPESFEELGEGAGVPVYDEAGRLTGFQPANFVLGFGRIGGRRVVAGGEDFTLKGGSPNPAGLRKSVYAETLALQYRLPLIRLHEGGGGSVAGSGGSRNRARPLGEAVFAPARFAPVARSLSEIPVASAALGAVAGLPAARLVSSHFVVMARGAQVLIAGPRIVERALHIRQTKEELGGPEIHLKSGVADNGAADENEALAQIRTFLSYLPGNAWEHPPRRASGDDPDRCEEWLIRAVPRARRRAYDMRRIIAAIFDRESFFEMTRAFGPGLITGLARLDGEAVGVIANDCRHNAGAMTAPAARKLRRFIDTCSAFHLPVLSLVDEPGFMIGPQAEAQGAIREGMAAMSAVMQCRTPWASVIVRKVFGVAGAVHFAPGAFVLSWPSAESGAVPIEGGVAVAFRRQIEAAQDPEAMRRRLEEQFAAAQSPFPRAEGFSVHELIDPRQTRPRLCRWLAQALAAYRSEPARPFAHGVRP